MKTKILLVLLPVLVATVTSASDKYVSTEFGFAASFPAAVVSSQTGPDVFLFKATAPGSAWEAQVKVSQNVAMPQEITKGFMEAKLAEVINSGGMKQSRGTSYATVRGHPAVLASAVFVVDNTGSNQVSYATLVNIKLVFVKSRNPAKGNNRIYMVDGLAIQGQDRSAIQQFIDSFELK
ncbi:MAG TPA: hypothetical protein VHV29_07935 [Terriglobales bacterium]|jgi:hypothetical protein|nr:hypothetical protein [Terriglobales bacterium]